MARLRGRPREIVECVPSIDIGALRRAGIFATPEKRALRAWKVDDSIVDLAPIIWDGRQLAFRNRIIEVERVPCPFGGERHFFWCHCRRRVAKLYSPNGGPWRCRHCYGLTYGTRQATPRDRYRTKAQDIRRSLGGGPNLLHDFPARPRGMHRKRYERLLGRHNDATNRSTALLSALVIGLNTRRAVAVADGMV
jgi:hypothetical protein